MTRDDIQTVHDDIAYMRALAVDGRRAPLLGGSILIAAGLLFGSASIAHYGIDSGIVDLPPVAYAWLWGAVFLAFIVALNVLQRRIGKLPGATSLANRAAGTAWMGVGLVIFTGSISMAIIGWKYDTAIPALLFPSLIFAVYGAGWAVSATVSGVKWQWALAIAAWIAAPALAFLAGEPTLWLAYAAGLFLFALLPGILLVRQQPSLVV
ncbi:hypothetical protein HCU40_23520 [Pseudanabaena biceps]|nr:hypothetical protein [Pseudanabaena biceps]